jgi:hypothetical protein
MKLARRAAFAVLILCIAPCASAATMSLPPSDALRCMTPGEEQRGAIDYPIEAYERKIGGTVDVELTFTDASSAPRVTIAGGADGADGELARAVRSHVRKYRVPCLAPDQTATVKQSFRFTPTDGRHVSWTQVSENVDLRREALSRCVTHLKSKTLDYPERAQRRGDWGTVAVALTFKDATGAPEVEVLDDTPSKDLIDPVVAHAAGYRMPCHVGEPLRVHFQFSFRFSNGESIVVKDMGLRTYLRSVKDITKARVYFDFNDMKCPFDLRVQMNQPVSNNRIGEVGAAVPERRFFLDWLSRQSIQLDKQTQNKVMGQSFNVSVPCGVLTLGNQGGGGAGQ